MICVTIACGSHTRMIKEHQSLVADGVSLVELRLDFLRREPELHRLFPERPSAIVVTIRRPEDGGLWRESEEKRQLILRSAIADEVEFVDLEVDIADKIPVFGKTRRIISYHNLKGMPDDLETLHREMASKSPYFIKIAVNPNTVSDMFRFIKFVREKNVEAKSLGDKGVRVIGICMGEMGKATRILGKKFGMPYTYATFSSSRIVAPGLLDYKEMRDIYHYDKNDENTAVFGIIGNPIGHSLSPLIHNRSFLEQKINAVYVPFPLDEDNVPEFMRHAAEWDVRGISVTIPHKVTVLEYLTKMDSAVDKIGACNTVLFQNQDRIGYNTDYMSALSSIELGLGGTVTDPVSVMKGKLALILGAGGAGKALAFGLKNRGALVSIADINGNRAFELSKHLDCDVVDWAARTKLNPDILVNCTPVGMHPNVNDSPFDKSGISGKTLVFDAIYNPENTLLIKSAKEKGCKVVTGVDMFVGQACLQFKLFTGQKASASFMRQLIRNALSATKEE
ncbi:MAG: shikimate dehydrogenase [Thermoguttaceae bacterium]